MIYKSHLICDQLLLLSEKQSNRKKKEIKENAKMKKKGEMHRLDGMDGSCSPEGITTVLF